MSFNHHYQLNYWSFLIFSFQNIIITPNISMHIHNTHIYKYNYPLYDYLVALSSSS